MSAAQPEKTLEPVAHEQFCSGKEPCNCLAYREGTDHYKIRKPGYCCYEHEQRPRRSRAMGDMADWLNDNALMPDEDGAEPCPKCDGSGKRGHKRCPDCDGTGYWAMPPEEKP